MTNLHASDIDSLFDVIFENNEPFGDVRQMYKKYKKTRGDERIEEANNKYADDLAEIAPDMAKCRRRILESS